MKAKTRLATAAMALALVSGTAMAAVGAAKHVAPHAAAAAPTIYKPNPVTLQLGQTIAHRLLAPAQAKIDKLGESFPTEARSKIEGFTGPRGPEYIELFIGALRETWPRVSDNTEAILTHAFAERMSPSELKAGAWFVQSKDGEYFMDIVRAKMSGKAGLAKLDPKAKAAMMRLQSTPAGQRFLAKVGKYDAFLQPYAGDLIATVVPPILGKFSAGVIASNDKRLAADKSDSDPEFAKVHAAGAAMVNHWYEKMTPEDWDRARHPFDQPGVKAQLAMLHRPEIPEGWLQAAAEAGYDWMHDDQAKIADAFGRFSARMFDAKEVEALGRFVDGPYADAMKKIRARQAAGETAAPDPKNPFASIAEMQQALKDFAATDEGKSMTAKLKDFKKSVPAVLDELVPLVCGELVRFADKAEKLQADKRLARGW